MFYAKSFSVNNKWSFNLLWNTPLWGGASEQWVSGGTSASRSSGLAPDFQPRCRPDRHLSPRCVRPCGTAENNTMRFSVYWSKLHIGGVWMYKQIIIHDCDEQADLIDVLRGNIKHDGLIVRRVQRVPLGRSLSLLQPPPIAHKGHFHVWIWKRAFTKRKMVELKYDKATCPSVTFQLRKWDDKLG